MSETTPLRVVLYSPDRARHYDGRTRELQGVGGGISARLSMVEALAALGHDVTAYVHCESPIEHRGVRYQPLDAATRIDCDVFIAISTGGALTFAPLRDIQINAALRLVWVQGVPKPADLDAVGADYVYVASNFLRDVCATRWGVPAQKLFVCYNGLHQEYFEAIDTAPPARDPFGIAYVGPPEKGLDACIGVLRRLRADDERFHLDVFGGAALWGRTESPAASSSTGEPGVRFMGLLGQRDLAAALFQYEYCLALQAMEEGFGIGVQEARRAGAIVIASRVGAFTELIRHRADGYLIDRPHNSAEAQEEAARLILDLADDPGRRERIRRRARATPWDWQMAARTWTAHWQHALAVKRAGQVVQASALDLPDGTHALADGAYRPGVYPLSPLHDRASHGGPLHALIAGYYGHGNLGDEAILSVMLDRLSQTDPPLLPIVASGDPDGTTRRHDVDAVHERDVNALRSAAGRSALIVLGGGGLFHDYHGVDESTLMTARHWGLPYCAAMPVLARAANTPLFIAAAGVGPLQSEAGQRYTRVIFERADAATVRDQDSKELLDAVGVETARIAVAADPAFLVQSADRARVAARLRRMGVPEGRPLITVALRAWDRGGEARDWEAAVAGGLDRAVADRGATILFVPFQSPSRATAGAADATDDSEVAARVRGLMQRGGAAIMADPGMSPSLVQGILEASDVVVAMRLHAVILSANVATPFVALRYDDKISHTASRLGLDRCVVDLATITPELLHQRVQSVANTRDDLRAVLRARLPGLREAAARTFALPATLTRARAAQPPAASPEWAALFEQAQLALSRRPGASQVSAGAGGAARRAARALIPAPMRSVLREGWQRRLMSPAAFVFDRYKRARIRQYGSDLGDVRAPGDAGLVSVVLPAYNGGAMFHESVDSILGQTYARFELIIVNDGSTDGTGAAADDYARRDPRVRVVHQANLKLPAALSAGMRLARGEFLTWTSCDNRLKPSCLQHLVDCLRRHPRWDMAYGNLDVIDEHGQPLRGSGHFASYQQPHGSEHVTLPASASELNVRANNFVGAGFLYRSRVAGLLGDYDRFQFGLEDYDYWMRVNALMTLRHADFAEPVVEYRFHGGSLTARADDLGLPAARERTMVFDHFRRDFYLSPAVWIFEDPESRLTQDLMQRVRQAGHLVHDGSYDLRSLPALWMPLVHVTSSDDPAHARVVRGALPPNTVTVLLTAALDLPLEVSESFDLCIALGPQEPARLSRPHQGWLTAPTVDGLFHAIDVRAKTAGVNAVEALAHTPPAPVVRASIVICTVRASDRLTAAIDSALAQADEAGSIEVVVVNNNPGDAGLAARLAGYGDTLRRVTCPIAGLSAARNAGIAAAQGQYVCFLDDDAVAEPAWAARLCRAFDAHPETGVIGGPVLLDAPKPRPPALVPGWESYWSHFTPTVTGYTEAESWRQFPWGANWAARRSVLAEIGGFRTAFGRGHEGFGGGEELVAAAQARRLGHRVAIIPDAVVRHRVEPRRFTFEHVRETMGARHLAAYAAGRELLTGTPAIAMTLARLLLYHVDVRSTPWRQLARDAAYRKAAQLQLLRAQWHDLQQRRRGPVDGTP